MIVSPRPIKVLNESLPARYSAVCGALAGIPSTGTDVLTLSFRSPGRLSAGLSSHRRVFFFMGGSTVRRGPGAIKTLCLLLSTGCGFNPSAPPSVTCLFCGRPLRRNSVSRFSNAVPWAAFESPSANFWRSFFVRLNQCPPL